MRVAPAGSCRGGDVTTLGSRDSGLSHGCMSANPALEVIEGHRKASSGTVRVFGQSPTDRRSIRPRTGIMLQESGFSGDLTVAESVQLIGRLTGRSDVVDQVLKTVDLSHKADTRVSQLSG